MSQYIRCDYCNKTNNIDKKVLNNPIVTGFSCIYCSQKLDTKKLQEHKVNHNSKLYPEDKNNIVIDTIKFLTIIAALIFAIIKYYDYQNNSNNSIENNYTIVQNPESGIHLDLINKKRIAPFTIITNGYSNYYVKLKSTINKQNFITIFINKRDKILTKVPLGTYTLTYTNGENWYGTKYLFGKQSIHEAEGIFNFTQNQQKIYGHTVTLYGITNGNLQERTINKDNF